MKVDPKQFKAVSWGNLPNKVHAIRQDGKTMCGLEIPSDSEKGLYKEVDAILSSGHACRKCRSHIAWKIIKGE